MSRRQRQYPGWTGHEMFVGKTAGALTAPNFVTVTVWDGDAADGLSATSKLISCYCRFANLATTKWVVVVTLPHGHEIIAAEC